MKVNNSQFNNSQIGGNVQSQQVGRTPSGREVTRVKKEGIINSISGVFARIGEALSSIKSPFSRSFSASSPPNNPSSVDIQKVETQRYIIHVDFSAKPPPSVETPKNVKKDPFEGTINSEGRAEGRGKLDYDGKTYEGLFKDGRLVRGTISFPSGDLKGGFDENGKFTGEYIGRTVKGNHSFDVEEGHLKDPLFLQDTNSPAQAFDREKEAQNILDFLKDSRKYFQ